MTDLFKPMDLGGMTLPNRLWMSAMTRTRASEANVPTALMAKYFAQRAAAGLIVTDCTAVSIAAASHTPTCAVDRLRLHHHRCRPRESSSSRIAGSTPCGLSDDDRTRGMAAVASGEVDAVAYGTLYIANPDLVARFEANSGLNEPDPSTFYGSGPEGYTDYPTLEEGHARDRHPVPAAAREATATVRR